MRKRTYRSRDQELVLGGPAGCVPDRFIDQRRLKRLAYTGILNTERHLGGLLLFDGRLSVKVWR